MTDISSNININSTSVNLDEVIGIKQPTKSTKKTKKTDKILDNIFKKSASKKQKEIIKKKKNLLNTEKFDKIYIIQKYQNSDLFGEYVKKTIGIKQSETQLQKLTETQLDEILYKIRTLLDNKNIDKIFDSMTKTFSVGFESVVTPFYNIDGFSDALLAQEEFHNCMERIKIESKLPNIPPTIQLGYIVTSTMLIQHQLNQIGAVDVPEKQKRKFKQKQEMKEPDITEDDISAKPQKSKVIKPPIKNVGELL